MPAYFGTWQVASAQPVPPQLLALARKLVGGMLEVGVPKREWRLADGSVIHALIVNGVPKVTIIQQEATAVVRLDTTDLWAPRGLVVYPAYLTAPFGFGLPIVQDTAYGPYDNVNLAPGLDTKRWTAGGPCGEVLLSPDVNAGYPANARDVVVPLLYHPTLGPVFEWAGSGSYDARTPGGTWSAYRMELSAPVANYSDEDVAQSKALFEALNTYRSTSSAIPLNLLPRGYYRPAKVTVSIMQAAGSTDETNTQYPVTYQTSAARLTKDGYSADLVGGTYSGWARGDNPTAFELRALGGTPNSVVETWVDDAPNQAILTKDVGHAAFGDVGYRGGYWCADVISRTRWIEAGNCNWQSEDADLPPLSWHGFASMNLAWETYPATYNRGSYTTDPLTPLIAFTGTGGDCWLNYPRSTTPTAADAEPAMGRHIYLRGRAIAQAPRGGLVWGACVQANGAADRLIALVHHPEDQSDDYTTEGWTRYLRVWWVDIPRRNHLRVDPQMTVCGEDLGDAWGWRGGTLVDVGHMPAPSTGGTVADGVASSLKYASQWRFNGDGTRAVCMRDYGIYSDYSALYTDGMSAPAGMEARAVELVFTIGDEGMQVDTVWHDYTGTSMVSPVMASGVMQWRAIAQAVDYAKDGSLWFAFVAGTNEANGGLTEQDTHYLGTGSASTQWYTDLSNRVQYGADIRTATQNFFPCDVLIADVNAAAFVVAGMHPQFQVGTDVENPDWVNCWPFTEVDAHGVRMYERGTLLDERWWPMPDGVVSTPVLACTKAEVGASQYLTWLPLAASAAVQPMRAQRFDQRVFGYQVGPLPQCLKVLDSQSPPSAPYDNCGCWVSTYDLDNRAHWMTYAELNPRGGHVVADVPMPANDWLIYAKAV